MSFDIELKCISGIPPNCHSLDSHNWHSISFYCSPKRTLLRPSKQSGLIRSETAQTSPSSDYKDRQQLEAPYTLPPQSLGIRV